MARPDDAGSFAEEIYTQMAPVAYADEDNGWSLLIFLGALGQMFQHIEDLARPISGTGPWTGLLDIDQLEDDALPWFGQFIGVVVDTSLSFAEQRQQIRDHVGWARGRPKVLKDSIRKYLTGSQTVELIEQDTSPYHFSVVTYDDETPAGLTYQDTYDDFLTYQAFYDSYGTYYDYMVTDVRFLIFLTIEANKPAMLQFSYTVTPGSPGSFLTYETLWLDWDTYKEVFDNYETYQDVYIEP